MYRSRLAAECKREIHVAQNDVKVSVRGADQQSGVPHEEEGARNVCVLAGAALGDAKTDAKHGHAGD